MRGEALTRTLPLEEANDGHRRSRRLHGPSKKLRESNIGVMELAETIKLR
jgi:hypothetical protein